MLGFGGKSKADVNLVVGADMSQVDVALKGVEGRVGQVASRLGSTIENRTAGVRKLSGALSSTVGIATSSLGAVTAIVGVVGLLGKSVSSIVGRQEAINAQLAEEERRRIAIAEQAIRLRIEADQIAGRISQQEARRREVQLRFMEQEREITAKITEQRKRLSEAQSFDPFKGNSLAHTGLRELFGGLSSSTIVGQALGQISALEQQLKAARGLRNQQLQQVDSQLNTRAARKELELKLQLLRAIGDERGAQEFAERARHERELSRIAELEGIDSNRLESIKQQEESLHQARLNRINEQLQKQRELAEERRRLADQAEKARVESERLSAEELIAQQRIAQQRALGNKDEAERLQGELDLKRRIRLIENTKGLTDEERQREIKRAREIARLRATEMANVDATLNPTAQSLTQRTLQTGLRGSAGLTRQVFGRNTTSADFNRATREQRQLDLIAQISKNVREIISESRNAVVV